MGSSAVPAIRRTPVAPVRRSASPRSAPQAPDRVVDLGCGDGELTATLTRRWPGAQVVGLDSSAEMLARAASRAGPQLTFRRVDVARGTGRSAGRRRGEQRVVPVGARPRRGASALDRRDGAGSLVRLPGAGQLRRPVACADARARRGRAVGVVAAGRGAAPRGRGPVTGRVRGRVPRSADGSSTPGRRPTLHLLRGPDPVLEWVRGTGLRPVLAALPADRVDAFEAEYAARLRQAYPARADGLTAVRVPAGLLRGPPARRWGGRVITGYDHVQVAIPAGSEDVARGFYGDLLAMTELAKPPVLARRGGCWFTAGDAVLHLGVEEPFAAAAKAHPAFVVTDLDDLAALLESAGLRRDVVERRDCRRPPIPHRRPVRQPPGVPGRLSRPATTESFDLRRARPPGSSESGRLVRLLRAGRCVLRWPGWRRRSGR